MKVHGSSSTLFRRVYLHGVLLLLAVAVALAVGGFFFGRDVAWRVHPEQLAKHLGSLLAALPTETLPAQARAVSEELDVDVAVYRRDGRLLAAAGRRVPSPLSHDEVARLDHGARAWRHPPLHAAAAAGPDRYLLIAFRHADAGLLSRAAGFLSLIVLAVALASVPLARAIAQPIEHLGRVARRLGEGDLAARSGLSRADEIGMLAGTFDEMAERLGRLVDAQRELLANVSHELRTPLARIRVTLGLAAEAEPAAVPGYLREIETDVAELDHLVADVLTASRLDGGGGLVLHRQRVDPADLLQAALERFARSYPERAIQVRAEAVAPIEVEAALLGRALDNLLDNAARHSDSAAPIEVTLGSTPAPAREAVFEIRDHGAGIDAADLPHVFTPFFRSDRSRARHSGGVGLGLALCRRIIEAHGGTIRLDSRPGQGTAVQVRLPLIR